MDKFYLLTNETLYNLRSNELFREFLTEFFYELKIRCLLVHTRDGSDIYCSQITSHTFNWVQFNFTSATSSNVL